MTFAIYPEEDDFDKDVVVVDRHWKLRKSLMRVYLGDYEMLEKRIKENGVCHGIAADVASLRYARAEPEH